jgi:uncharacterized protein (TIGR03086 family)
MSQQHVDLWRQAAEAFDQRYQAVGEGQWESATPCAEWSVKDLVGHAAGVQQRVGGGLLGLELDEGTEWPVIRQAIDSALEDESALEGMSEGGPFGPMPRSMMLGVATSDLLLHTWDLARAIGADERLPAEVVTAAYVGLQKMPEEALRSSGRFAAAIDCAPDADEQTRLLSFAGRQV